MVFDWLKKSHFWVTSLGFHFHFCWQQSIVATILENSVELCHCFNKKSWLFIQHNKLQHSQKLWINHISSTMSLKMTITTKILPRSPYQLWRQRGSDDVHKKLRNVRSKLGLFGQNVQTVIWPSRIPGRLVWIVPGRKSPKTHFRVTWLNYKIQQKVFDHKILICFNCFKIHYVQCMFLSLLKHQYWILHTWLEFWVW